MTEVTIISSDGDCLNTYNEIGTLFLKDITRIVGLRKD